MTTYVFPFTLDERQTVQAHEQPRPLVPGAYQIATTIPPIPVGEQCFGRTKE
ncbi:hypothetical protein [Dictyobacter kobayashii]|uniref:hypothetical protein n=1 Tax=Dictyobacter kobayashii TaxID=2014872 RepID=UPI001386F354|nr:hypothetical protein [Dictyobacter kobayashii]